MEPGDTYDVINQSQSPDPNLPSPGFGPSLGVVDDTCEVHFEVSLQGGAARANADGESGRIRRAPRFRA